MNAKINDGGPAFPRPAYFSEASTDDYDTLPQDGMTLRDYFAGKIIGGLCARPSSPKLFDSKMEAAESAYEIADAMLEARKKGRAA